LKFISVSWLPASRTRFSIVQAQSKLRALTRKEKRVTTIPDVGIFCRQLAVTQRVLLVPGNRFGCQHHVRLGFGATTSEFEAGLARLSADLETFS